jgi:hypothetical protein
VADEVVGIGMGWAPPFNEIDSNAMLGFGAKWVGGHGRSWAESSPFSI